MQDPKSPETGQTRTSRGVLLLTHRVIRVVPPVWPPVETADYLAAWAAFSEAAPDPALGGPAGAEPSPLRATRLSALAARRKGIRGRKRRARGGAWLFTSLIFLMLGVAFSLLALSGKPLHVPVWAVAEVESRMNQRLEAVLGQQSGGSALSLGGIVFVVDADWIPRLRLEDLRLLQPDGSALLSVPELRASFDPGSVVRGLPRLRSLRLIGARLNLRRMPDGQFYLALGAGVTPHLVNGVAGMIDAAVAAFAQPVLDHLTNIQAEAMSIRIDDRLLGRVWDMGDGRMRLLNRKTDLALELGVSLVSGGADAAQADLTLIAAKATSDARLTVKVDQIAAADLASQAAPLAFLKVLDAPISGQIFSTLNAAGGLASLEARLAIAAGTLHPSPTTNPVPFEEAGLFFSYDAARERIDLRELTVRSASLRLSATGQAYLSGGAYLPGAVSGLPDQVLAQIHFSRVTFDPEGLFEAPVMFDGGALDLRLRLNPFTLEIGQMALQQKGRKLLASGAVSAQPGGWSVGLDLTLNSINRDDLLRLWPDTQLEKSRTWVAENVQQGNLSNLRAGVRLRPGETPILSMGYDFSGATVRYLDTLPPILNGAGYAAMEGLSYTTVLTSGQITAPQGGDVDLAGSVFNVTEITQKPAISEISLHVKSSLTAVLSLLDQPPFEFISQVNLPVTLGQGQVSGTVKLRVPLQKGNTLDQIAIDGSAAIRDFTSDVLIPDRALAAPELAVAVASTGMEITGKGTLNGVAFKAQYSKDFGPAQRSLSQIRGTAELSRDSLQKLAIAVPPGLLRGSGSAAFEVDLERGQPAVLHLTSDLAGVALSVPEVGWSKPAAAKGILALNATLSQPPVVNSLQVEAAGLKALADISLNADGSLGKLQFSKLQIGDWLDAKVDLTGRGAGQAPALTVSAGMLDLRGLGPKDGSAAAVASGGTVTIALDRLIVTKGVELTGFRSQLLRDGGGLTGAFVGRLNGQVPVSGSLGAVAEGTAVHLVGDDAGAVLSAAGVFPNAQGGALDISLKPTGAAGSYDGVLKVAGIRIYKAPALAELINAISVVGILDQMNGGGLLFSETEAEFRLTPKALQITRGSATGGSLGVSVSGLYVLNGGRLDMQGVISPVYLLNGIGALFSRKGEGLFGFNYKIAGTVQEPKVSVNPLSILTPGLFREIFRAAPPKLEPGE